MIFNDPAALTVLINIFFAVAAASVVLAVVAVTLIVRRTHPSSVPSTTVLPTRPARIAGPSRHVA